MTEAEFDSAAADVYDSVKTFLKYCSNGSSESAVSSAMEEIKVKYGAVDQQQYRKLRTIAHNSYSDMTRKTSGITPQRFQGKQK